jgi:hypothetical protein
MAAPKQPPSLDASEAAAIARMNAAAPAPPPTPTVRCTFGGQYYKAAGGSKGKEYMPFEATVEIPLSAVSYTGTKPIALFKKYYGESLLRQYGAPENGWRNVELFKVEGELPQSLPFDHELDWTADYDRLRLLAQRVGKRVYDEVDLKEDTKTRKEVEIIADMYPSPSRLREAIRRILSEPAAFAKEQQALIVKDSNIPKQMESEIAALIGR